MAMNADPLWYKDAVIYQVHVKAFFDSNADGTGDFLGLTDKLDYIQDLGVTALWLLPFYPSPMRDDGYDISDYRNVHPAFGTLADFKKFVREAHRRGLKVITELVINHTSDQHPWFQAARTALPGSPRRDFYVWSTTKHKFEDTRIIFTDTETSNWTWDDTAQAYYWHRFFSHQPDLNHNNPRVVDAVIKVMRFWLDIGVDGLRLDAIPYLCVRDGTNNENLPETHDVIRRMRAVVDANYAGRLFLAEANQWPEDVREYFGDGDECHMAYHFPLMPRMYMAIAQEDRHPIVEIMRQTPPIPPNCQWAIFLRNHDELTLEMVTDRERDYMYRTYAFDRRMRINLGIRRRLAPLMDNDPDKLKLMNSLLLSMPGSPIVYYGDEIAMGDNIYLGDRNGVRTPMQWSPDRNAGFSRADPQRLYLPPVMDAIYGFQGVNVEAQTRDPSSLLNWMKRILVVRKSHKAFGRGSLEFLHPGNRKILAYVREYEDETILCVMNLGRAAQPVELDLSRWHGRVPIEMMGHTPFPPIGELPYLLTLSHHGVYWFLLASQAEEPLWHKEQLAPLELPVVVLFDGWHSFVQEQPDAKRHKRARELREQTEREVLPAFLQKQRWFVRGQPGRPRLARVVEWQSTAGRWLLVWVETSRNGDFPRQWFMPLALLWEDAGDEYRARLPLSLAKARQQARIGLIHDAYADAHFCHAIVDAMGRGAEVPVSDGRVRFHATRAYASLVGGIAAPLAIRHALQETSNTPVVIAERLFLKGYRQLADGTSLEVEMGRFLTEESPFANVIPMAGWMDYEPHGGGEPVTLAVLQSYVENQGDGWSHALDYLRRYLERCQLKPPAESPASGAEIHAPDLMMMHTLGRRTGELHKALAVDTGNPAFAPEEVTPAELEAWHARVIGELESTLTQLSARTDLPESARAPVHRLVDARAALRSRLESLAVPGARIVKTRHHGDFHLGQVLVAENDFIIIDFEGEPARPLADRRAKHSPLRDVAGMLRSFDYAAAVALQRLTAERPADHAVLEPHARQWQHMAGEAFLLGYRETVGNAPFWPSDVEHARRLLDLFLIEKALYEIRYELSHRPEWVVVPVRGILDMMTLMA